MKFNRVLSYTQKTIQTSYIIGHSDLYGNARNLTSEQFIIDM
jgi:hypothetical protein